MPTESGHRHCKLVLNGTEISGFGDDPRPVELPEAELIKTKVGADGALYGNASGMRGGEVKIKLAPTSPSTKFLMQKVTEIHEGARIEWNGSYGDSVLNYTTELKGGLLTKGPKGIEPETDAVFTFYFEELIPDFAGANFNSGVPGA